MPRLRGEEVKHSPGERWQRWGEDRDDFFWGEELTDGVYDAAVGVFRPVHRGQVVHCLFGQLVLQQKTPKH